MSPISCFCSVSLIYEGNCRWCARSGMLVRCSEGLWRFGNVSVCHVIFISVTQWSDIRQWKFSLQDVMVTSDWSSGIWNQHIHAICSSVNTAIAWSNGINHWHFLYFRCKGYTATGTGLFCLLRWSLVDVLKLTVYCYMQKNEDVEIQECLSRQWQLRTCMVIWKWNCSNEVTPVHYSCINKLSYTRVRLESELVVQLVKKSLHFCWIWGFSAISMIGLYWILSSARLIHFTFSP